MLHGLTVPIACFGISHPALHDLNIPACDSYPAKQTTPQNRHVQFSQTTWLVGKMFHAKMWLLPDAWMDYARPGFWCEVAPAVLKVALLRKEKHMVCLQVDLSPFHATISTSHTGPNGGRSDESDCQSYSGLAVLLRILTSSRTEREKEWKYFRHEMGPIWTFVFHGI